MKNTFGLFIDNLCIDEVLIDSEGDDEVQQGAAEYFFRMRMGYNKIMEEKGFEIHLMTPNTDETINTISKEERIDDIVSTVDEWPIEQLIDFAKKQYRHELERCSEELIIEAWHDIFSR